MGKCSTEVEGRCIGLYIDTGLILNGTRLGKNLHRHDINDLTWHVNNDGFSIRKRNRCKYRIYRSRVVYIFVVGNLGDVKRLTRTL